MTKIVPAAATALSFLLLPVLAQAEPGQGHGNGRGMIVLGEDGWRFCPPGLAGREPACVPPGQARQAISDEEREQRRAQRRAERLAAREAEAEQAELEQERQAGRADGELALAASEDKTDALDAASVLAALLAPEPRDATSTSAPAQVTPVAETLAAQSVRVAERSVPLHEALAQAAATGEVGY